jgi:cytochrome c oxidase assembly protein subunit 15
MTYAQPAPFAVRALRLLTPFALLLALVVTTASAWLRLNLEGQVCAEPAQCAAVIHVPAEQPVRLAHRAAASVETLVVLALAVIGWRARRDHASAAHAAWLALAALVFLAVLGATVGASRLPVVTWGNLGGGLVLIGALAWLHGAILRPVAGARGLAPLARRALRIFALQLLLGALASAGYAGVACTGGAACGSAWADASWWELANPASLRVGSDGIAVASPLAVALLWLHRTLGVALSGWLVWYAARLRRSGLLAQGRMLVALAVLQVALGLSAIGSGLPATLAVLHNALGALLLLTLAGAAARAATARTSAAVPGH